MLQRQQQPKTPKSALRIKFSIKRETRTAAAPTARKTGQHFFEKRYSAFITMGWNTPIRRNAEAAMMMPVMFI